MLDKKFRVVLLFFLSPERKGFHSAPRMPIHHLMNKVSLLCTSDLHCNLVVEEGGMDSSESFILVKSVTGILMKYGYKRHSP